MYGEADNNLVVRLLVFMVVAHRSSHPHLHPRRHHHDLFMLLLCQVSTVHYSINISFRMAKHSF